MQLVFHTGAHATDERLLLKCLTSNKEMLQKHGVILPRLGHYRPVFRKAFDTIGSEAPPNSVKNDLLEAMLEGNQADRVVLSHVQFFGTHSAAIGNGRFYPLAGPRMAFLTSTFSDDQVEWFMGLRNPGSFIPKILMALPEKQRAEIIADTDLSTLSWADMVTQVREMAPSVKITLWCNEDTPLIWGEILCAMGGLKPGTPIRDEFSLLASLLSDSGKQELLALVRQNPGPMTPELTEQIADTYARHAQEDMLEEELGLPDWTEDVVEAFSELYSQDIAQIEAMPGVHFIKPTLPA